MKCANLAVFLHLYMSACLQAPFQREFQSEEQLHKETILFVLDTPDCCGKSSNGWRLVSSTGISPSHGSHATAPIACDGFTTEISLITLGLWLDGSIIVPIACRRHIGSRPILIADCYSLLAENESQRPKNIQVKSRCFLSHRSWRSR